MTLVGDVLLAALAIPVTASCAYLLLLTLLSRKGAVPMPSQRQLRFDVIVPAHNEAAVIADSLASLRELDWPADRFRILVVADNCDDSTAAIATKAGASVLTRDDTARRGKGYALAFAFARSRQHAWADAVVVVDADARVSPNLLEAFASRIETGALAIQAHYGVSNPQESWRTRLMAIAHGAFHELRSRAREHLSLSCGIRGNGWCVTHDLLDRVAYRAFSVTEDLEFGLDLALAGYRVHYAGEASADAVMESSEIVARGQRQRWEGGRFQLVGSHTAALLIAAVVERSWVCLDMAMDLLVLPLSYVALATALLLVTAASISWWQDAWLIGLWLGIGSGASLLLYVLRGWQLSGSGMAGLADLFRAPFFVAWKLLSLLRHHDRRYWAPTKRRRS